MNFLALVIRIVKMLGPLIREYVIPAVKMVQQVKRLMKESGTGEQLRKYLKAIFKDDAKVDIALNAVSDSISRLSDLSNCFQLSDREERLQCFLDSVRRLPIKKQKGVWRDLARLIVGFHRGDYTEDSKLNAAIELGYQIVKEKEA